MIKLWIVGDEDGLWVTNVPDVKDKAVARGDNTYNVVEVEVNIGQQPIVDLMTGEELPWRFN